MKGLDKTAGSGTESNISLWRVFRGKGDYLIVCSTILFMEHSETDNLNMCPGIQGRNSRPGTTSQK